MAGYYFRAPRYAQMPHVCTMLDSIGNDKAVAKFLNLSTRTIAKYRRDQQAPKPVMYALFWETPWGTDAADCQAVNDARIAYSRALGLERINDELRRRVDLLERELASYQKAANTSFFKVV